jgi:hypothetical protein
MTSPCPACRRPKTAGLYLCRTCWPQLPLAARRALYRRDARALARLRALLAQIEAGVPLNQIEVTS